MIEKIVIVQGKEFSSFKITEKGDFFFFPLPGKARRQFHWTIHSDFWNLAKGPPPPDILKALKKFIPRSLHITLEGGLYIPHCFQEIEEAFNRIALWNEEWEEEEFLLFPALIESFIKGFEEEGDKVIVRTDSLVSLFKELRVVGGREMEKAKPGGIIRKSLAFHPAIGGVSYPLVIKSGKEIPTKLQSNEEEEAALFHVLKGTEEWAEGADKLTKRLEESILEAIFNNKEAWDYLKKLRMRQLEGFLIPPPTELPLL